MLRSGYSHIANKSANLARSNCLDLDNIENCSKGDELIGLIESIN